MLSRSEIKNLLVNWNQAWGGQIAKKKHVLEALHVGVVVLGVVAAGEVVALQLD